MDVTNPPRTQALEHAEALTKTATMLCLFNPANTVAGIDLAPLAERALDVFDGTGYMPSLAYDIHVSLRLVRQEKARELITLMEEETKKTPSYRKALKEEPASWADMARVAARNIMLRPILPPAAHDVYDDVTAATGTEPENWHLNALRDLAHAALFTTHTVAIIAVMPSISRELLRLAHRDRHIIDYPWDADTLHQYVMDTLSSENDGWASLRQLAWYAAPHEDNPDRERVIMPKDN